MVFGKLNWKRHGDELSFWSMLLLIPLGEVQWLGLKGHFNCLETSGGRVRSAQMEGSWLSERHLCICAFVPAEHSNGHSTCPHILSGSFCPNGTILLAQSCRHTLATGQSVNIDFNSVSALLPCAITSQLISNLVFHFKQWPIRALIQKTCIFGEGLFLVLQFGGCKWATFFILLNFQRSKWSE